MTVRCVQIAVDAPIDELLTYEVPNGFQVKTGSVVNVPLGKRQVSGVVFSLDSEIKDSKFELKKIVSIEAEYPAEIISSRLNWAKWLSEYYFYPIGQVAQLLLPPLLPKAERKVKKSSPIPIVDREKHLILTEEQKKVFDSIPLSDDFKTHLIYGVTGSGKTEIYLQLFSKVIESGKTGLFLLPEISLTPQLLSRFAKRFGSEIAVLHSQLTARERTEFWFEMVQGKKKILLGARSALFCPVPNLGLIVVDEEHEASFKQDEKLKYNGRDSAIMLAKESNCPIILGSATPSFESWNNAKIGKYQLHTLLKRPGEIEIPKIQVVDLKTESKVSKDLHRPFWLTPTLFDQINFHLDHGYQSALFLNRRGMSQSIICPLCGYTKECPNCDIKLTLHSTTHLVCHYCDYHESFKHKCPDCKEGLLETVGVGTEGVEVELKKYFPTARLLRIDRDEIQNRLDLEAAIQKIERLEVDIIIGTQMISKGLDFPKLKLVALILADVGFNLPDFRASERSVQIIQQMSGRAGRHLVEGEHTGTVLLQTFNPESEVVQFAKAGDYEKFCDFDLENRKLFGYPPFQKLISFRIQSNDLQKACNTAQLAAKRSVHLQNRNENFSDIQILGPTESPIAKIRNEYRFQILFKSSNSHILRKFIKHVLHDEKWIPSTVKLFADVDPLSLL